MNEAELAKIMMATEIMTLEQWPNDKLAALHLAITGFGEVPKQNMSYERAVEEKLVKPGGIPWEKETLEKALVFEVNRRMEAGTFV